MWVEAVLPLTITPVAQVEGDEPTVAAADLVAAAAAVLPADASIVSALTVDEVDHVMGQQAYDLQETIDVARTMILRLAGSVDNEIADRQATIDTLLNIAAMLPPMAPRDAASVVEQEA